MAKWQAGPGSRQACAAQAAATVASKSTAEVETGPQYADSLKHSRSEAMPECDEDSHPREWILFESIDVDGDRILQKSEVEAYFGECATSSHIHDIARVCLVIVLHLVLPAAALLHTYI